MKVSISIFGMLVIWMLSANSHAAPTSIDGVIGAEWAGANVESVLYNPSAPIANFGAPTNENHVVSYDVLTRGDSDYLYVGLATTGPYAGGFDFANLYLSTNPADGSNIGFEVTLERAFVPGVPGYYNYTSAGDDIHFDTSTGVIELAVPWEVFTENSLGLLPAPAVPTDFVQLRLSQSFGYSVAGGSAFYGDDRLGIVGLPVPEPSAVGLVGLAAAGLLVGRRRS
jgi:hypothetical protein